MPKGLKAADAASFQEKRRKRALEAAQRDRSKRRELAIKLARAHHEEMAQSAMRGTDSDTASDAPMSTPGLPSTTAVVPSQSARMREFWSRQMMHPEWMTSVPGDLGDQWLVMARPEGQRCLVASGAGWTVARNRTGVVIRRFKSRLPGGGLGSSQGADGCVLDCVFDEQRGVFWVTDVVAWRGVALEDCGADFRLFWAHSKSSEDEGFAVGGVPGAGRQGGVQEEEGDAEMGDSRGSRAEAACEGPRGKDGCPFEFRVVPFWPATAQGVRQAYRDASVEFDRDGLLFLHKGMMYAPGGTPLALLWKDPSCSRFFLETDAEGRVPTHQVVSLRLRMDGTVATEDDPPVVVARMPNAFMDAQRAGPGRPMAPDGRLLRFSVREGGIVLQGGAPAGADLRLEGVGNQRRGRADTWSKVLFQYMARNEPLGIDAVMGGCEAGAADGATRVGFARNPGGVVIEEIGDDDDRNGAPAGPGSSASTGRVWVEEPLSQGGSGSAEGGAGAGASFGVWGGLGQGAGAGDASFRGFGSGGVRIEEVGSGEWARGAGAGAGVGVAMGAGGEEEVEMAEGGTG